jgi:hypothetical protein
VARAVYRSTGLLLLLQLILLLLLQLLLQKMTL